MNARIERAVDPTTVDDAIAARARAKCGRCPAPIFWGRTLAGKSTPIDFEPVLNGNQEVVAAGPDPNREGETVLWIATYAPLTDATPGETLRFVSHFATCPAAASFSKKGRARRG